MISCRQIVIEERVVDIPRQEWKQNQYAVLSFEIKDSSYRQLYFIIRHTDRFPYNRLLAALTIQDTAKNALRHIEFIAPLTDSTGAWKGSALDDTYYTKVPIDPPVLLKPGLYRFALQHKMQDDPLPQILNIGLAIEKVQ